ncbi:MAG: hypothetical protein WC413_03940 [Candidatus Nanoarchaeia archaeon]
MIFEIDVSGEDILNSNYSIVVADKNNLIRGFKFTKELIEILNSRKGEGKYRYNLSKQGKAFFRVRLYCIIIYYIFKEINIFNKKEEIKLEICRDFQGHEKDITSNLKSFLKDKLGLNILINYVKLPEGSNADKYAYIMRRDTKNIVKGYVKISLEDIEKYLIKK